MAASAPAAGAKDLGEVFGFTKGELVSEFGYDSDVDQDLREALEDLVDAELEDEDTQEIVDGVVMWWRDGDGDLVDALVDAIATLTEGGPVWLLTPKARRTGYVDPKDIAESADLAGLRATRPVSVAEDWTATLLASPKH